ncbi:hypothetical protein PCK1_002567 [Pneumocystis canis]|nr:hypothetical protein PCK1_002567 [Pneumocystis canis]
MNNATITIRLIKSFVYRTIKYLILHEVNLEQTTVYELQQRIQKGIKYRKNKKQEIKTRSEFNTYATYPFGHFPIVYNIDTLKIYAYAHKTKTSNRVINLDHDEWILDPIMTLATCGIRKHETELSFFRMSDYEQFKACPEEKW